VDERNDEHFKLREVLYLHCSEAEVAGEYLFVLNHDDVGDIAENYGDGQNTSTWQVKLCPMIIFLLENSSSLEGSVCSVEVVTSRLNKTKANVEDFKNNWAHQRVFGGQECLWGSPDMQGGHPKVESFKQSMMLMMIALLNLWLIVGRKHGLIIVNAIKFVSMLHVQH
jgi:hypothetical protein